jgi:glycosyltransferase involved in cell wall biosynthesis
MPSETVQHAIPATSELRDSGTWVVVPLYNEASVIGEVLRGLRRRFDHVVVVDDGSTDGSADAARPHATWLLKHLVNRGQGAAIQTGTAFALSRGAPRVAHFDADGQHDVRDLVRMVERVSSGACDIAIGDRFAEGASEVPASRRLLLRGAILFHRIASGVELSDVHNGLRVFSREAAERIEITADRMAHASELVDLIAQSGLRVEEVPVRIRYSEYSLAKGQRWSGGFRVLFHYLVGRLFG